MDSCPISEDLHEPAEELLEYVNCVYENPNGFRSLSAQFYSLAEEEVPETPSKKETFQVTCPLRINFPERGVNLGELFGRITIDTIHRALESIERSCWNIAKIHEEYRTLGICLVAINNFHDGDIITFSHLLKYCPPIVRNNDVFLRAVARRIANHFM